MRSRSDYILTKDEVHGCANHWLGSALRLEYEGTKCTTSILLGVLLLAAARVASICAVCRDLADAPSDQTIRGALGASLPEIGELERRLNRALCTKLPRALLRKGRMIAIDLVLIPYHGQPESDEREIYRSQPKSGTSHFHAYATAVVVHKGYRYVRVEGGEAMKDVVRQLLGIVRRRDVRIKFLLLDKGFFSTAVVGYLRRAGHGFIIPAMPRGRKPKPPQKPTGLRALQKQKDGYYRHTLTGKVGGHERSAPLTICVASKQYTDKKTGKRCRKKLLYAVRKVRRTPREIRETYRKRFGIETTYRQMNEARIRSSTRSPRERLLFVGIALVLRNVWVWLHFKLARGKSNQEPQLFLKLLPFKEMLLWIMQIVGRLLGADRSLGIQYKTYQRLAATTDNYQIWNY